MAGFTYLYICPNCSKTAEHTVDTADLEEFEAGNMCDTCKIPFVRKRIVWYGHFTIDNTEPHYNYGLGARISSNGDKQEAIRRIRGESGVDPVEVGNDDPKMDGPHLREYG